MRKFFSKTKLILIIVIIAFVVLSYFLYINRRAAPPTPPAAPPQQSVWKGIVPGTSTEEEVKQKLGTPKSEGENLLEFESTSPTRNHTVSLEESVVGLIKEVVSYRDTTKVSDLRAQYGETSDVLYGPDAENGYYLFVYSEKGVAYLGNPATETLLEIWYFPATTFEDFVNRWAASYSRTLSPKF